MDDRHEIERVVSAARLLSGSRQARVKGPAPPAPTPLSMPASQEFAPDALREIVRDVLRDEVRTRMGRRINENIRRILCQELSGYAWLAEAAEDVAASPSYDKAPRRRHGA